MADSNALRCRRYREHKAGMHYLCRIDGPCEHARNVKRRLVDMVAEYQGTALGEVAILLAEGIERCGDKATAEELFTEFFHVYGMLRHGDV